MNMQPLTPDEDAVWQRHADMIERNRQAANANEPTRDDIEALLQRIRAGMTTDADADLVQHLIGARG